MASVFHPIINGPSKWDLSIALFDRKPKNRIVTFDTNCPLAAHIEVSVLSVQAEDGSGESWNIEGLVVDGNRATWTKGKRVFIHFYTNTRSGQIRFFE